jgi:hypothetical protein
MLSPVANSSGECGLKGFPLLNVEISERTAVVLAEEACGSPQLMQRICLDTCLVLNCRERLNKPTKLTLDGESLATILEQTSTNSEHGRLVEAMHRGKRGRGVRRKLYRFRDGSGGDVYRAVLLALAGNPPTLQVSYGELLGRVERVCIAEAPPGSSVTETWRKLADIVDAMMPNSRILEWDDETLTIADPYLLSYLRASKKLEQLGSRGA